MFLKDSVEFSDLQDPGSFKNVDDALSFLRDKAPVLYKKATSLVNIPEEEPSTDGGVGTSPGSHGGEAAIGSRRLGRVKPAMTKEEIRQRFPSPPKNQHPFLTDEQLDVVGEALDWEVEASVKDMKGFVTATTSILGDASRSTVDSFNAFLKQQKVKTIPRVFKKRAELFCKLVMKA
jgi:hypothetical protein